MTDIVTSPALDITAQTTESFEEFSSRIYKSSKKPLRFKDGKPIELDPTLEHSFLMLGLSRLATQEEFTKLYTAFMTTIAQMEVNGDLPADWVKSVATPFDVIPPAIPPQFTENLGEAEIKTYLVGEVGFAIVKEYPPEPEMPFEPPVEPPVEP